MFKLLSFVALFALLAVAFASDAEKSDQSADELFFASYGYWPTAATRLSYGYRTLLAGGAYVPYRVGYQAAAVPVAAAALPTSYRTGAYYAAAPAAVVY